MIPFFQFNFFPLGPLHIQIWGLFVSVGVLSGLALAHKLAKKYFLSTNLLLDSAVWTLLAGLAGGRLFYILFYNPEHYLAYPMDVFKFWAGGSSSLGGFFGAAAALYIFAKIKKISWTDFLPYFDIITPGLFLGWGIGRLGCFFIHDHPGRLTNFFLGVNFPGGARFDLGLLESLLGFAIFVFCFLLLPRLIKIHWGLTALASVYMYALVRFFLDFLRATDLSFSDPRYAHLTPAQWGMMVILLLLTLGVFWGKVRRKNIVN